MEATKTYKDFQKVAQMRMRQIQNQWSFKKADEAQLAENIKNSRLFYQIIKELYVPQQSIFALWNQKTVPLCDDQKISRSDGVNIIANSLIAIQSMTNQYWISLSNMIQSWILMKCLLEVR